MTVQCCMCHRVREGEKWQRVQDPGTVARNATHTFCPRCEQRFRKRWGLVVKEAA